MPIVKAGFVQLCFNRNLEMSNCLVIFLARLRLKHFTLVAILTEQTLKTEKMELPKFKYSPNAFELDIFENVEGTCSVCNEKRQIKYTSSFYSVEEPEYICPWCIADGKASEKYKGEFNDYEGIENSENIEKELLLQASERTPSYTSWQQEVWLTHCNEPCAFVG